MADITKCYGVGCEERGYCWRFIAPSSRRQSYFAINVEEMPKDSEGGCDHLIYYDAEEEREFARMQGMAFGVRAYNEARGQG